MYKRILVPMDGSGLAECVFDHVKALATGCNVPEVDFVFVVETLSRARFFGGTGGADVEKLLEQENQKQEKWAKDYLAKVVKQMKAAGVTAKSVILKGNNPADGILNYVKRNGVDLVVMSTHGRSGPARWALGSVADKVVRHSDSPVLIVRPSGCAPSA